MQIQIPITAEISRNSRTVQYIPIGQGDNAYRFLVSLKNSGAAVEIPDGATVVLNCLKPDGTYTETVGSVKDGTAVFDIASNTVAVPGTVICEMQIFDGTQLTTQKFELRVEPSIISDDVIKSTDEYGLLIALIGKVKTALLSESVGTFAMTNYVGSVSGGLRISLEYPIEASGWRLFVGGKEITDRLIGADEAFVTAPAILDGEPLIKFYRDDDTVLEAKAKVTVKTDKARMGKLILMQN